MKKIIAIFYITITTLSLSLYGMKKELFKKSNNIFTDTKLIKKGWRNYSTWNRIKSSNAVTKLPIKNVSNAQVILNKNIDSTPIIKEEFSKSTSIIKQPQQKRFLSNSSKRSPFKKQSNFSFFQTKALDEANKLSNRPYSTQPKEIQLHSQSALSYEVRRFGDKKMEDKKLQDILQYFLDILKKAYGNGNTIELQDTFNLLKKKYAAPKKMDTSDDFRGELGDRLKEKHQKEIEIDRKIENLVYEAYKLFNKEQETKKLNFYVETLRSAKQEGGEELLENRFKDLLKSYAPRETFVTSSLGGIINKSEFEFEKDKTRELINKAYTMIKSEAEQELLKLKVKKDNS